MCTHISFWFFLCLDALNYVLAVCELRSGVEFSVLIRLSGARIRVSKSSERGPLLDQRLSESIQFAAHSVCSIRIRGTAKRKTNANRYVNERNATKYLFSKPLFRSFAAFWILDSHYGIRDRMPRTFVRRNVLF